MPPQQGDHRTRAVVKHPELATAQTAGIAGVSYPVVVHERDAQSGPVPMQEPAEAPADQHAHDEDPPQQPPRAAGRGPEQERPSDHGGAHVQLRLSGMTDH
jgi:hypothetical protein